MLTPVNSNPQHIPSHCKRLWAQGFQTLISGMSQIQLPLLVSQPRVQGGGKSWSIVRDLGLREASGLHHSAATHLPAMPAVRQHPPKNPPEVPHSFSKKPGDLVTLAVQAGFFHPPFP